MKLGARLGISMPRPGEVTSMLVVPLVGIGLFVSKGWCCLWYSSWVSLPIALACSKREMMDIKSYGETSTRSTTCCCHQQKKNSNGTHDIYWVLKVVAQCPENPIQNHLWSHFKLFLFLSVLIYHIHCFDQSYSFKCFYFIIIL